MLVPPIMPHTILSQERQGEKQVDVEYAKNFLPRSMHLKIKIIISRLALELQPTGEVPEYTANIAYALLREGKEGRHKVDSVKIVLKAEGKSSNYFNDITHFSFYL